MARRATSPPERDGADRTAVEAFYLRVMHRVCRTYRQRDEHRDGALAALLEQVCSTPVEDTVGM